MRIKNIQAFFLFIFVLSSCSTQSAGEIWTHDWQLETLFDSEELLVTNVEDSSVNLDYQMTIEFNEDKTFILRDLEENKSWTGTYTTEKIDTDYKLDVTFDDSQETYIGAYGLRVYEDGTEIPTITLPLDNYMLSFIANE